MRGACSMLGDNVKYTQTSYQKTGRGEVIREN
jgi:hypothetical protein